MEVAVDPIEVFYSSAHQDERLRKQLETHLSTLKRQGLIAGWHDRNRSAGEEWKDAINTHLNTARLILLLISPAFIASDYCYSIEMTRAMERHEADEARVIPIILRPTDWKGVAFEKLEALPTDAKPITTWTNRDTAFLDVAQGIRRAVEAINGKRAENVTSPKKTLDVVGNGSTPLRPWNVPYRRNLLFTGREDVLLHLHESFLSREAGASILIQAISGLGGMGKTQIALEYAYRYRDEYQAVLWAKADSRETLVGDFVKIADLLKLPTQSVKEQNLIVNAVKNWLEKYSGWLLILDNADDLKAAEEFIPSEGEGHILLTTRAQATGPVAHHTEIERMEMAEAILLLLRRASIISAKAELDQASS